MSLDIIMTLMFVKMANGLSRVVSTFHNCRQKSSWKIESYDGRMNRLHLDIKM